ncbi:hypothetical protein VTK56DRAFT_2392 [Thermocarpiscus australiensis]
MSIYIDSRGFTYLVDVHTLGSAAFTTATPCGTTLKSILESPRIIKVFFDVRNDSDALHHHYGVRFQGVEDVQLMENAARRGRRAYLQGLERCITEVAPASDEEKKQWKEVKQAGIKLFAPEKGGSYEVFNARPLSVEIARYCVNDVRFLPQLRAIYWRRLSKGWRRRVEEETVNRVLVSQSEAWQPQAKENVFGPWEAPERGRGKGRKGRTKEAPAQKPQGQAGVGTVQAAVGTLKLE